MRRGSCLVSLSKCPTVSSILNERRDLREGLKAMLALEVTRLKEGEETSSSSFHFGHYGLGYHFVFVGFLEVTLKM